MCPNNPKSEGLLLLIPKAKGLLLTKFQAVRMLGATLVSGDNAHNSGSGLRSSQAFHLEKGPFFSKDSNTVANL